MLVMLLMASAFAPENLDGSGTSSPLSGENSNSPNIRVPVNVRSDNRIEVMDGLTYDCTRDSGQLG